MYSGMVQTWGTGLLGMIVALTCTYTNQVYGRNSQTDTAKAESSGTLASVRISDQADAQGNVYTTVRLPDGQIFVIYLNPDQVEMIRQMSIDEKSQFFIVRKEAIQAFLDHITKPTLQSTVFDGQTATLLPNVNISAPRAGWSLPVLSGLTKLLSDRIFELKKTAGTLNEIYFNFGVTLDVVPGLGQYLPFAGDREFAVNFGYQREGRKFFFRVVKTTHTEDSIGAQIFKFAIRPGIEATFGGREQHFGQALTMKRLKLDMGSGAVFSPATLRNQNGEIVRVSASATWSPYSYDIPMNDGIFHAPNPTAKKTLETNMIGEVSFSFETLKFQGLPMTVPKVIASVGSGIREQIAENFRAVASLLSSAAKVRPGALGSSCRASI